MPPTVVEGLSHYVTTHIHTDGPIPGPHSLLTLASAAYTADGTPIGTFTANLRELPGAGLHPTSLTDWRSQFEVNATGAFLCTRAVLDGMRSRDSGRIVTVASTASHVGYRYTAGYTASKHAAVGFMRAVAAELAGTGVTANAVCPAFVRTDMTATSVERIVSRSGRSTSDAEAALAAASPLGRLLEPAEVAFAVSFLAATEAAAINGQTLVLDGGGIQS